MLHRIIVTDMDDTMIKSYGMPTVEVCQLWNELKKKNDISLVIATGQSYTKVKETFVKSNMILPDFIISNQGTVVYSTKENKVIKKFVPDYKEVTLFLHEYIEVGGDIKYIRVSTPDKVIVYDCEDNRRFYEKNIQGDIIFRTDFWNVIAEKEYTKIVCSAPNEIVEKTLKVSNTFKNLFVLATGKTKFGNANYSRIEIMSSNKCMSLEYLLQYCYDFPSSENELDILCLGDEISDLGLAEVAVKVNSYSGSKGCFAIICNDTVGNNNLRKATSELSSGTEIALFPSIKEDGWVKAINCWL